MARIVRWSIMAIAGPAADLSEIKKNGNLKKMYDKIHYFDIPDDYGEFPDTSGYTADNWEQLESTMEDGNLYPYMQKCLDAVMDYTKGMADHAEKNGYWNIKETLQWPKFGGKIFAIVGFVRANTSSSNLILPAYLRQ